MLRRNRVGGGPAELPRTLLHPSLTTAAHNGAMAEILPFRRTRKWTRPSDYGVLKPRGRSGGGWLRAARESGPILWALPLAAFVGVFVLTGQDTGANAAPMTGGPNDRESAQFGKCGLFASRNACVIDGDTFWYQGRKIRVADINTPETSEPDCAYEAELGARATARLTQLLNAGPFTLDPIDRAQDQYGRALFVVTRGGESVGATLVREGLAEEWQGFRREWC